MLLFEIHFTNQAKWLPVRDWPKYEVSDSGLVRVAATGRLVAQWNHTGRGTTYKRVTLRDEGKRWNPRVHRLVADAFDPGSSHPEVDHIDGDSFNNRLSNLEWVTSAENMSRMRLRTKS